MSSYPKSTLITVSIVGIIVLLLILKSAASLFGSYKEFYYTSPGTVKNGGASFTLTGCKFKGELWLMSSDSKTMYYCGKCQMPKMVDFHQIIALLDLQRNAIRKQMNA